MVSSENIKNSECSRQLECISINELLKRNYNFFVPDYQRGYRWGEKEILALMNDLKDFCQKHKSGFYCLQPISLKQMSEKEIKENNLDQIETNTKEGTKSRTSTRFYRYR